MRDLSCIGISTTGKFVCALASRIFALVVGFIATVGLATPALSAEPARPQIWLTPFAPLSKPGDTRTGAPDYFDLFKPNAPWSYTAKHVQVFKIYRDQMILMSDAQLTAIIRNLASRHIDLAMESNALIDTSVCNPAIAKAKPVTPEVLRLKRLGADLRYLAMNEPLTAGHAARGPNDCQASIPSVAKDVATMLRPLLAIYPQLQIGDIEPIGRHADMPDWPDQIAQWMKAYQVEMGRPLAFLQADTVWGRPWRQDLVKLAQVTRAAKVRFGVLYDGDFSELSDAGWAEDTAFYAAEVEDTLGLRPDQVIFQSWDRWPRRTLPDSDFTTMTGMVRDYVRLRSRFRVVSAEQGRLTDEQGAPIPNAKIVVEVQDLNLGAMLAPQRLVGEVPAGAVAAVFGLRINAECVCRHAAVQLAIASLRYGEKDFREGYGASQFRWDLLDWARAAPGVALQKTVDGSSVLAISARPEQLVILNGPRFVVHARAQFEARFDWQVSRPSDGGGYIAVIFLGKDGKEVRRTKYRIRTTWRRIRNAITDLDGRVDISEDEAGRLGVRRVELLFEGDHEHRPAKLELR